MDAKGYANLAYKRGWDVTELAEMLANRDGAIAQLHAANVDLKTALVDCRRNNSKLLDQVKGRVHLQEVGGQIGGTVQNEGTVNDGV